MTQVQVRIPAGDKAVLASDALDETVGRTVKVSVGDVSAEGRVIAASVDEDGTAGTITVEVPDDVLPLAGQTLAGLALAGAAATYHRLPDD